MTLAEMDALLRQPDPVALDEQLTYLIALARAILRCQISFLRESAEDTPS